MVGSITSASEQAVAAVKVLLYIGPVAVYVSWLGLVNSQARPKLVRARDDFLITTLAFCPFAVAPVVGLARSGYGWGGASVAALILLVFLRLLPAKDSGWTIYNLSPRAGMMLADRALRSLGWSHHWNGRTALVADKHLSLEISFLPPLRSVTVHIRPEGTGPQTADVQALGAQFSRRLNAESRLPSVSGCCLLMGGVGLLALPLWMLSHHSAAIAEVVSRILLS